MKKQMSQRHRSLASGDVAAVEECACGILRVHFGFVTLSLDGEQLTSLWNTLGEALARRSVQPSAPTLREARRGLA